MYMLINMLLSRQATPVRDGCKSFQRWWSPDREAELNASNFWAPDKQTPLIKVSQYFLWKIVETDEINSDLRQSTNSLLALQE